MSVDPGIDADIFNALFDADEKGPCHPANGGIAGLRPYCAACGAMTQPRVPCTRSDCDYRLLAGRTDGVGFPE